jgi:hypothetical protein
LNILLLLVEAEAAQMFRLIQQAVAVAVQVAIAHLLSAKVLVVELLQKA